MEQIKITRVTRVGDWQSRLSNYLVDCAQLRFRYGVFDCGLFVANCVEIMTGVDVAHAMRGVYHNRREALEMTRLLSGSNSVGALADGIAAAYGIPEIPVAYACVGDAVQLRTGRWASMGIVAMHINPPELLTPYSRGLLRLPLRYAVRAWRV